MTFKSKILKWRMKKNFTQERAAKFLGVSIYTYRGWEQKSSTHKPSKLARKMVEEMIGG